jgi:ABC-2 type transport system permease protein
MKGNLVWTIVHREWRTRVVKRSFILGTLLTPLLSVGLIAVSVLLTEGSDVHNVVLVEDAPGLITRQDAASGQFVPRCPGCFPERENLEYRFVREAPEDSIWQTTGHTVLVEYDESVLQNHAGYLVYVKSPGVRAKRNIERDLSRAMEHARVLGSTELDWEAYQRLKLDLTLFERESTATGREEGGGDEVRGAIGFMFSAVLFMVLAIYGGMIMRSVVEEKSNHVVEVLVSTISPEELLLGKVVGLGAVALTQILAWALLSTVSFALFQSVYNAGWVGDAGAVSAANGIPTDLLTVMAQNEGLAVLLDIQWGLMVAGTVAFFIGGFLLYGSLYAAVGASVQSEQEGQGMVLAIIMPLMFAYIVGGGALSNPNLPVMVWLGWVPLTAPVMMLVRLATGVTWWEVLLSWGLLMLTARIILGFAGRMYRLGVLHDGGRSGWKLWMQWIKGHER